MDMAVAYAALSGASFALIPLAYRLGRSASINPMIVNMSMGVFGTIVFAVQCRGECLHAPIRVWMAAVIAGGSQYLTARLIRVALGRGPVASFWCTCSLGFLVVVGYAWAFLDEHIAAFQLAAVGCGIASVVVASFTIDHSPGVETRKGSRLAYGALLAAILLLNGGMGMAVKDLSARAAASGQNMLEAYRNLFFLVLYAVLGVLGAADVAWGGGLRASWKKILPVGLLAGIGSTMGMVLLALAASHPAAVVFTINSTTAILVAAVLLTVLFKERVTAAWCATVLLSVLTLVLAQMN